MEFASDLLKGGLLGLKLSKQHIIDSYVKVPIGILLMLLVLYGVNEIIILTTINFPSSVTCMLLLYLLLILSSWLFGPHKTSKVVAIINIPAGFALRWINIFFTPAFIPLPLSDWISAKEVLTIAAVFVFGFLIAMVVMAYFTVFLQRLLNKSRRSNVERAEELGLLENVDLGTSTSTAVKSNIASSSAQVDADTTSKEGSKNSSATASRSGSVDTIEPYDGENALDRVPTTIIDDIARGDEDEAELQYRKSLNLSRVASKREDIEQAFSHSAHATDTSPLKSHFRFPPAALEPLSPVAQPKRPLNPGVDLEMGKENKLFCKRATLEQKQVEKKERYLVIAHFIQNKFDYFVFFILFIASLPVYFTLDYAMLLHLSVSIATFLLMINAPPPKWKRFLHPVLCSVGISWLIYYIFSLMKHDDFLDTLRQYKTGRNYLTLFNHRTNDDWPGAGDVMSTLMDCSIVSLSIPMYTYRNDLKRHFFALLGPILLMTFSNFFIYPPLCYHLGISPERSLGFAGRSVTLALGTPFVSALGGSQQLMACTTVVTGIVGALLGQFLFGPKVLRIREDDYVTRGITLGLNCSAIATAHLLSIDPRAGAMSSLAFCLFGTFMVILGSIAPLANVLKGWVGL